MDPIANKRTVRRRSKRAAIIAVSVAILIGLSIYEWQRNPDPSSRQSSAQMLTQQSPVDLGFVIPEQIPESGAWQLSMANVVLPNVGVVNCRVTTKEMDIPFGEDNVLRKKVRLYMSGRNIVRIESVPEPGWRNPRPISELEEIMRAKDEKILGFSDVAPPKKWVDLFRGISKFIDLRRAKYFDASFVSFERGGWRGNVYIFNIFGAGGMDGVSDTPSENNLRVIYSMKDRYYFLDNVL